MPKSSNQNLALFLVSFLLLFLELALIRFISTEVRIFAYFSNMVLLACFLGLGLGCYFSNQKNRLYLTGIFVSILILFIKLPIIIKVGGSPFHLFTDIPIFLAAFHDTVIHHQWTTQHLHLMQVIGMSATFILFFNIMFIFIPLGQIMGSLFDQHDKILMAYSINIVASLLGVWAFSTASFYYAPPWLWFIAALGLIVFLSVLIRQRHWKDFISVAVCLLVILNFIYKKEMENKFAKVLWTPYQKISLYPLQPFDKQKNPFEERLETGYEMNVNNVGFMELLNLSDQFRTEHPVFFTNSAHYTPHQDKEMGLYDFPYYLKPDPKKVLIFGAGAGNDAAAALRHGAQEVTAVEIDPGVCDLGKKYHPEKPYQNPRLKLINDDARSFIKKTQDQYDMIVFGLLDAQSQSSSMNNMRMDHYVYTLESFQEVRKHLKDDGLLVVSFFVLRQWIGARIAGLIEESWGTKPVVLSLSRNNKGLNQVLILISNNPSDIWGYLGKNPKYSNFAMDYWVDYKFKVKNTTDDWPYLYLEKPQLPMMHLCFVAILLMLLLVSIKFILPKEGKIDWHFFFLGAAFLLLEFQNINKTALLFGSTWIVNAWNISAILILILAANIYLMKRKQINVQLVYLGLFISLAAIYLIPLDAFNIFPPVLKIISACLLLNLPIFFAGIIFGSSFRAVPHKNTAYGSNIIGAVVGGLLEYLSIILGIRALTLLAIGLYALSMISKKR